MTFQENLILATLSEQQGTTLSAEQVASIIECSDVNKVRSSLETLTDSHVPVIKTEQGYTIPKNTVSEYIAGMAIFGTMLSLALFI